MNKKVYLIGAGPGDVQMLTLKAVEILKKADVVLYDALIDKSCLELCKKDIIAIDVGKRKNQHTKQQDEINRLLIQYANEGKLTVRLKGGTPFVFGRGYEEVIALSKANIEPIVIAGVSSTTSVFEYFMIPLIFRDFNSSYRTITGHDTKQFQQIITPYNDQESLVIVMGIYNLKQIVQILYQNNYPKDIKVAILSKAYTQDSKKMIFTLEFLLSKDDIFFDQLTKLTPAIIFVSRVLDVANSIA
jgi:uroporphyrin-III C-methyltransferase